MEPGSRTLAFSFLLHFSGLFLTDNQREAYGQDRTLGCHARPARQAVAVMAVSNPYRRLPMPPLFRFLMLFFLFLFLGALLLPLHIFFLALLFALLLQRLPFLLPFLR